MRVLLGILVAALLLSLNACRKQDIRVAVIKTPGLKNAACAKIIQDAFLQQPGIKSISPDFEKRELVITYNSMLLARKNLEYSIAQAGFSANDILAFSNAAALPPECR